MYVYKIRPLSFIESMSIAYYFETKRGTLPRALASYIRDLPQESADDVKKILNKGLVVAQKFGCPEKDALKCKKYSDVFMTTLAPKAKKWLTKIDFNVPIIFWKHNDITYMLSTQRLQWLDPYAICMFGLVSPDEKVFPNEEELEKHLNKLNKSAIYLSKYD